MVLNLNEPVKRHGKLYGSRERYREFYGENVEEMPRLSKAKRIPLSVAGLMKLRLRALDLYASVLEHPGKFTLEYKKEAYKFFKDVWTTDVDTGDMALYHPDGKIKIALDSELLSYINPDSGRKIGGVPLPSGLYAATEMPELTKDDVQRFRHELVTGRGYLGEPSDNKFLRILARDPGVVPEEYAEDSALLGSYIKAVNLVAKIALGFDIKGMGVYVSSPPEDVEIARLWRVSRLYTGSDVYGWLGLRNDNGRLVGVVRKAPRLEPLPRERLEEIVVTISRHSDKVRSLLAA